MKPVVSVRELMKYTIDPMADNIFLAVGVTETVKGTVNVEPKTEDDWEKVRAGAVSLAETANLLRIRRPFTPDGDENDSKGPDAVELSPTQITEKVERDPVEWNARVEALKNVALSTLDIARRKNTSQLWEINEELDEVCEACHRSYWYPGENAQFYRRLQDRLDRLPQKK